MFWFRNSTDIHNGPGQSYSLTQPTQSNAIGSCISIRTVPGRRDSESPWCTAALRCVEKWKLREVKDLPSVTEAIGDRTTV